MHNRSSERYTSNPRGGYGHAEEELDEMVDSQIVEEESSFVASSRDYGESSNKK
jgi:hypothetical protein